MRRILGIFAILAAAVALMVTATGADDGDGGYQVRAVFDNAGFAAPGMDVRVAGANVGSIAEMDVSFPDEAVHEDGSDEPGKAIVVLQIDDPGFQDFRTDATCQIYPQSLLGEKYVDCSPTQERAPGSDPPPELAVIPDGERGEGQRLLPLEQNGKSVDIDLVNNIMREPYPDRFRLILNDLGAGLAARGDELGEIIERSNPALRETNEVLATLARQNRKLETLSEDSDAIMTELARERERVGSFINESTTVGEATLSRRAELEETFARFPGFLRELRSTMTELRGFSDAATPVFSDLGDGAPALTRASKALGPFADAATRSFTSLGDAADAAGPALAASDPVVRQTRNLARDAAPTTRELGTFLSTFRRTGGFQRFFEALYGLGGVVNAYDTQGHFARAMIPLQSCFDYRSTIGQAGCDSRFDLLLDNQRAAAEAQRLQALSARVPEEGDAASAESQPRAGTAFGLEDLGAGEDPEADEFSAGPEGELGARAERRSMRDLLDFMFDSGEAK